MKKNKKSKGGKFLAASVVIAILIMAGGTFAWFTSKDEVTNRLTASSSYGVTITETFKPTENWIPGQEVTKEVKAVNTGNIDAFVRLALSNELEITTIADTEGNAPDAVTADPKTVYVELSEDAAISRQAGGYRYDSDNEEWVAIESDTLGSQEGLNVFRREIGEDEKGETTYEYAGYYYVPGTEDAEGTYYDVKLAGNEADGFTTNTTYLTKNTVTVDAEAFTLDYSDIDNGVITATYYGTKVISDNDVATATDEEKKLAAADDLIINIKLENGWSENWKFDEDEEIFYYMSVLKPGDTTESLVSALELDEDVTDEAYYEFVYDLTVALESVQATGTADKNGRYTGTDAVTAGWENVESVTVNSDTYKVTWTFRQSDGNESDVNGD